MEKARKVLPLNLLAARRKALEQKANERRKIASRIDARRDKLFPPLAPQRPAAPGQAGR